MIFTRKTGAQKLKIVTSSNCRVINGNSSWTDEGDVGKLTNAGDEIDYSTSR